MFDNWPKIQGKQNPKPKLTEKLKKILGCSHLDKDLKTRV